MGAKGMKLRGYQQDVVDLIHESEKDTLIQAPTGAGKTIIFSHCIRDFANMGQKTLVLAHRGELIRQAEAKLRQATGIDCGVFSAYMDRKEIKPITVGSVQSVANTPELLDFDNVIIDEAHRVKPPTQKSQYRDVIERVRGRLIGFTATPYRLDGGAIYGPDKWWTELSYQIELRKLINEGYLCDYKHKIAMDTSKIRGDLKKVKLTAGEYNEKQSGDLMTQKMNLHAIVNSVQDERHIVVFCVSIMHAEELKKVIGDDCVIVHSKMKDSERDENLKSFDNGDIRWMVNVGVLTEGWDCTRVDAVVLARPTKSTALYVQMVGRGLRLHDGKNICTIYDIVGNYEEFGFVDNPKINNQEPMGGEQKPKVCPECFSVIVPSVKTCPDCGYEFVQDSKNLVKDERDDFFEMKDVDITENQDFGDVVFGYADYYDSKAGNKCLRVSYTHTKRNYPISHYYPLNQHWIGTKLATIVRTHRPQFKERWLAPGRFMKAVNGGYIFPMKGLMIKKDGKYEKISTL